MKSKIFSLISIITISFINFSCSSDDDNNNSQLEKKLTQIEITTNGNTKTNSFVYNINGKWVSGLNEFNQEYNINYNAQGKISQFNIPSQGSSTAVYEYNSTNTLNGIMVDNYEIDFIYNNFRVTELEIYDPNILNTLRFTYDSSNRIKTITSDDDLQRWEYTYDNQNRISRIDVFTAANSTAPYTLSLYAIYEYESHKSPIYKLLNEQFNQGILIYSPFDFFPTSSRIFAYNIGIELSMLPEYNIKSVKEYLPSNSSVPRREIDFTYVLQDNEVQSYTYTSNFAGNITTQQVSYTYE